MYRSTPSARLKALRCAAVTAAGFLGTTCGIAHAQQFQLSGFGSVVAGTVTSGEGYIANYVEMGIYGNHGKQNYGPEHQGALNPETRFGVQANYSLTETTRATTQLVSRGAYRKYAPQVEWLFLTHDFSPNLNVQAGKMRVPVYLYSDKIDNGFAYPWLRVPADTYSLDFKTFNGFKLNHDFAKGDFSQRTSLWGGVNKADPTMLMSYLFGTDIHRKNHMVGVVSDSNYGPWQLRVSYTKNNMSQTTENPAMAWRNETLKNNAFLDVAAQYQVGNWTLVGEWNKDHPFYRSYFASAIYQTGANSYYLTHSKFILDLPWEKHRTLSVGWRRDIGSNMDVKVDLTRMRDLGTNPFTNQPNPVIGIKPGHASVLSVAFDFIF